MKTTNKQSGFTIIEAVVVILVIGILAAVGFYVFNMQKDKKAATASVATTEPAEQPVSAEDKAAITKVVANDQTGQVKVDHQNGAIALGKVTTESGQESLFLAAKQDGTWNLQSQDAIAICDELIAQGVSQWDANCTP